MKELSDPLHRAVAAQRLRTAADMMAELAHQLNQPLAAIAAYAHGCELRLLANAMDPADLHRVLEAIAKEALRAGAIIRESRRVDPCQPMAERGRRRSRAATKVDQRSGGRSPIGARFA